jgi:hypothetical protein
VGTLKPLASRPARQRQPKADVLTGTRAGHARRISRTGPVSTKPERSNTLGTLTSHVAQLCGEIVSSRNQRHALNQSLAQETLHRKASVSDMCSDFTGLRRGMARSTLNERQAFLANLRRAVRMQRCDMQTDLAGVSKAWAGK